MGERRMRINQYLAKCGVDSRRKCEELVKNQKVTVNGEIITDLSFRVDPQKHKVEVNAKPVSPEADLVYYVLNKPKGIVSAVKSLRDSTTVVSLIPDENRIFPVGRLDKETEGLIFVTNDGDFAYMMTHPKFEKEKEYEALVRGRLETKDFEKLKKGVDLEGKPASAAKVRLLRMSGGNSLVSITLTEGRNRQVRKMFERIGHKVLELKRVREGCVTLGELKPGEYRKLTNKEVFNLMNSRLKSANKQKERKPAARKGSRNV